MRNSSIPPMMSSLPPSFVSRETLPPTSFVVPAASILYPGLAKNPLDPSIPSASPGCRMFHVKHYPLHGLPLSKVHPPFRFPKEIHNPLSLLGLPDRIVSRETFISSLVSLRQVLSTDHTPTRNPPNPTMMLGLPAPDVSRETFPPP